MQHLVDCLKRVGLSDQEAKVYMVSLSLGDATVQEIAHASQIMRTTAYSVIDSLVEKGLICSFDVKGRRLLTAESPNEIVTMLKRKAEKMIWNIGVVETALPELFAVENKKKDKPRVYFFEGKDGITKLSKRYESISEDFYEIVPFDELRRFFDEHEFDSHKERMVRSHIKGRIIIVADKPPVESMKRVYDRFGWEVRYMENGSAPITGHLSVKGDEIYGFAYDGIPIGVVIENPPLASAMKRVFELAWESAPTDIAFP
jgi:sugar-specific transcriptional regulator TrmB